MILSFSVGRGDWFGTRHLAHAQHGPGCSASTPLCTVFIHRVTFAGAGRLTPRPHTLRTLFVHCVACAGAGRWRARSCGAWWLRAGASPTTPARGSTATPSPREPTKQPCQQRPIGHGADKGAHGKAHTQQAVVERSTFVYSQIYDSERPKACTHNVVEVRIGAAQPAVARRLLAQSLAALLPAQKRGGATIVAHGRAARCQLVTGRAGAGTRAALA